MSALHELSPHVLFSGEGIWKGHFWVQKMRLPRGSFKVMESDYVNCVLSMYLLDSLGTEGGFLQKPQVEPNFWPCILCEVPPAFYLFLV